MDSTNNHVNNQTAFTLIELLMALAIISILAILAQASYSSIMTNMRNNTAISDMYLIDVKIERFKTSNNTLPDNLSTLDIPVDPWGNAYAYLVMAGATTGTKRKDHNLIPINSDYDLYSLGPDGKSSSPLTAANSQDDIIRASNGGYIGVAADY